MIGKLFRGGVWSDNDDQSRPFWKRDNSDNLGQLFEGAPPNRAAAGSAGIPPAGRRISGKQAKRPMFSIISHPSGAAERPHRIFSLFTGHLSLRPKGATASCRALADGEREGRKRQTGQRGTRLQEGRREGRGRTESTRISRMELRPEGGEWKECEREGGRRDWNIGSFRISLPAMSGT